MSRDIEYLLLILPPTLIWASVGFLYIRFFVGWLGSSGANSQTAQLIEHTSSRERTARSSSSRDLKLYLFGLGGIHALLSFPYWWIQNQTLLAIANQISIALVFLIAALPLRTLMAGVQTKNLLIVRLQSFSFSAVGRVALFVTALVALFYLFSLYFSSPVEGWDSLTYWCKRALILMGQSADTDGSYYTALARHPDLNAALLAWTSSAGASAEMSTEKLPWILAATSTGFMSYGFVAHATNDRRFGVVAALACLTQPLLENHVGLAGYAEIWVTSAVLGAATFTALSLEKSRNVFALVAIIFSLTCIHTKNTWPVYVIPMICAVVFTYLYLSMSSPRRTSFIKILRYLIIFLLVLISLLQLTFLLNIVSPPIYLTSLISSFNFLGYSLQIDIRDPLSAFTGLLQVFFINQSFSVSAFLFLMTLYVIFWSSPATDVHPLHLFLTLFCLLFILELLVGLLLFPRLYEAALPGQDISFSRLILPFGVFAMITAAVTFGQRQRTYLSNSPCLRHQ